LHNGTSLLDTDGIALLSDPGYFSHKKTILKNKKPIGGVIFRQPEPFRLSNKH
jgi:hypothetical protein